MSVIKKKISRIVKQKLVLPQQVSYLKNKDKLLFKGPQGECEIVFDESINIVDDSGVITLSSDKISMSVLGTFLILFKNAMNGVHEKFEKIMNLYGVGYKVSEKNGGLEFFVGYSHSILIMPPKNIMFEIKSQTQILLRSCSKADLGDFAAKISRLRKVNPYKTKGIIEKDAFILKKEGKK